MRWRTSSGRLTTSNPSTDAVPLVGRLSVVRIFSVVDFPAPLGPSKPNMVPRATAKLRPSTARTGPNVLTMLWTSRAQVMPGFLFRDQVMG